MLHPFTSLSRTGALFLAVVVLTLGVSAEPDRAAPESRPELSEKLQVGITPLQAVVDAQKWDEAINMINDLIKKVDGSSYDCAFLNGFKAQILGSKGDFISAIEPLEAMLRIADDKKFFRWERDHVLPMTERDTLINLASLTLQSAMAPGKTLVQQRADIGKAHIYGRRLANAKKPTIEAQTMWARILFSEAVLDSSKVDLTLMKQAAVETEKALYLTIKPKEEIYRLLLASLQQLGDNERCAELLELLVQKFPNTKSYWPLLFNTYVAMQESGEKSKSDTGKGDKGKGDMSVDLSAVIALERAQASGQMNTNKDNFMLAGLYYNIQQYVFAAELLEKGLSNGKIDPEQKNWELLAACYQQMGKEARAIEIFIEAIRRFPKSSNLELQVGQIYYNNEKRDLAYNHLKAAVTKGLEKPGQTLVLLAYLSLEAKRLDDALTWAEKAAKADPKSNDAQSLVKIVSDSITERNNFLKNKK